MTQTAPYKIGALRDFIAWSKEVVRDPAKADAAPKLWCDSEATAQAMENARARLTPEKLTA